MFNGLLAYILSRKTITSVIYVVVVALLAELNAIGNSEGIAEFMDALDNYLGYPEAHLAIVFFKNFLTSGSYFVAGTELMILSVLIWVRNKEMAIPLSLDHQAQRQIETVLNNTVSAIQRCDRINEADFNDIVALVDADLKKDLAEYQSFERKRGNVLELQQMVEKKNLISRLREAKK